jgi:hypothetical protein
LFDFDLAKSFVDDDFRDACSGEQESFGVRLPGSFIATMSSRFLFASRISIVGAPSVALRRPRRSA